MGEKKFTLSEVEEVRSDIIRNLAILLDCAVTDVADAYPSMDDPLSHLVPFARLKPSGGSEPTEYGLAFAEMLYQRIQANGDYKIVQIEEQTHDT